MKKRILGLMMLSLMAVSFAGCSKKAAETTAAAESTTEAATTATEEETTAAAEEKSDWETKIYDDASAYYELKVSDVEAGFHESDSLHYTNDTDSYSYSVLDEMTAHGADAYLDGKSTELDDLTESVYADGDLSITYVLGKAGDRYHFYGVMNIGSAQDVACYLAMEYDSAHVIKAEDMVKLFTKDYISAEKLGK